MALVLEPRDDRGEAGPGRSAEFPRHDSPWTTGTVSPRFQTLAAQFDRLHAEGLDSHAELCVYVDGAEHVLLRSRGRAADQLQNVRSVSKALLSILAHALHERGVLDLDRPIAEVWPEFAAAGKQSLTPAVLLSHQAGLVGVDRRLSVDDVLEWDPAVEALAAQRPYWEPGTDHGYHDLTFGWGMGEYLRRATGSASIDALFQAEYREPLGAEVHIGVGGPELDRFAPFRQGRPVGTGTAAEILHLLGDRTSLLNRSQMNPNLLGAEASLRYLRAEVPGCNAVTSARAAARVLAATLGPVNGVRLWNEDTLRRASRLQRRGTDRVFVRERAYAQGFMLPDPDLSQAGLDVASFGHYGQDCALIFAVPEDRLAFAYTTTQLNHRLDQYTRTDERAGRLARAAVAAARGADLSGDEAT